MKDRLYNLMCEADIESGCVYGDCDLEFIADHLIDSGLVIALPCKMADTVWVVRNAFDDDGTIAYIAECELTDISFDGKDFWFEEWFKFGKEVFATKEEAEAKLAELKGE